MRASHTPITRLEDGIAAEGHEPHAYDRPRRRQVVSLGAQHNTGAAWPLGINEFVGSASKVSWASE